MKEKDNLEKVGESESHKGDISQDPSLLGGERVIRSKEQVKEDLNLDELPDDEFMALLLDVGDGDLTTMARGANVGLAGTPQERRDFEAAMRERAERESAEYAHKHPAKVCLADVPTNERFRLAGIPYITGKVSFSGSGSTTVDYDTVFIRYLNNKGSTKTKIWRATYRINISPMTEVLPVGVRTGIWSGVAQVEGFPIYRSVWDLGEDALTIGEDAVSQLWGGIALSQGKQRDRIRIPGTKDIPPAIGSEKYGLGEELEETQEES